MMLVNMRLRCGHVTLSAERSIDPHAGSLEMRYAATSSVVPTSSL